MIVDKLNKVIFIEIPKTGTSFIRHHLYDYQSDDFFVGGVVDRRHASIREISRACDLDPRDFDIHCFTRHPEDWLVSEFLEYTENHLKPYLNGSAGEKIRAYVEKRYGQCNGDPFDLNLHLKRFLTDDEYMHAASIQVRLGSLWKPFLQFDEKLDPDKIHIHKYEDFENSIEKLFTAFNKPVPSTKVRIHKTKVKKPLPNRRNRSLINKIYDSDFKQFGYKKRTVIALDD